MSKIMPPGMYGATIKSVIVDECCHKGGGIIVTNWEVGSLADLEIRMHAVGLTKLLRGALEPRKPAVSFELQKQRGELPTKAIHSNEPWKAKAKRQGRQIRKSK